MDVGSVSKNALHCQLLASCQDRRSGRRALGMWESQRDFQERWEEWKAAVWLSAFHRSSFPMLCASDAKETKPHSHDEKSPPRVINHGRAGDISTLRGYDISALRLHADYT